MPGTEGKMLEKNSNFLFAHQGKIILVDKNLNLRFSKEFSFDEIAFFRDMNGDGINEIIVISKETFFPSFYIFDGSNGEIKNSKIFSVDTYKGKYPVIPILKEHNNEYWLGVYNELYRLRDNGELELVKKIDDVILNFAVYGNGVVIYNGEDLILFDNGFKKMKKIKIRGIGSYKFGKDFLTISTRQRNQNIIAVYDSNLNEVSTLQVQGDCWQLMLTSNRVICIESEIKIYSKQGSLIETIVPEKYFLSENAIFYLKNNELKKISDETSLIASNLSQVIYDRLKNANYLYGDSEKIIAASFPYFPSEAPIEVMIVKNNKIEKIVGEKKFIEKAGFKISTEWPFDWAYGSYSGNLQGFPASSFANLSLYDVTFYDINGDGTKEAFLLFISIEDDRAWEKRFDTIFAINPKTKDVKKIRLILSAEERAALLANITAQMQILQTEISTINGKISSLENKVSDLQQKLASANESEKPEIQKEIEDKKKEIARLDEEKSKIENEYNELSSQNSTLSHYEESDYRISERKLAIINNEIIAGTYVKDFRISYPDLNKSEIAWGDYNISPPLNIFGKGNYLFLVMGTNLTKINKNMTKEWEKNLGQIEKLFISEGQILALVIETNINKLLILDFNGNIIKSIEKPRIIFLDFFEEENAFLFGVSKEWELHPLLIIGSSTTSLENEFIDNIKKNYALFDCNNDGRRDFLIGYAIDTWPSNYYRVKCFDFSGSQIKDSYLLKVDYEMREGAGWAGQSPTQVMIEGAGAGQGPTQVLINQNNIYLSGVISGQGGKASEYIISDKNFKPVAFSKKIFNQTISEEILASYRVENNGDVIVNFNKPGKNIILVNMEFYTISESNEERVYVRSGNYKIQILHPEGEITKFYEFTVNIKRKQSGFAFLLFIALLALLGGFVFYRIKRWKR
ncbi:MAG: hypothetical protein QXS07_01110 [Candidatus Pacearchaeota archaeon]